MRRIKRLLKLAALIPAIVLAGGFIGCRSGAFGRLSKPEPLPEPHPLGFNGPQPDAKPQATPPAGPTAPEKPPVFFSGTKSLNGKGITIGLTPAGTATPDLGVPARTAPEPPKP